MLLSLRESTLLHETNAALVNGDTISVNHSNDVICCARFRKHAAGDLFCLHSSSQAVGG